LLAIAAINPCHETLVVAASNSDRVPVDPLKLACEFFSAGPRRHADQGHDKEYDPTTIPHFYSPLEPK
jgi:hypothetical protein